MNQRNQEHDVHTERVLEELLSKAEPRPIPPLKDELMVRSVIRAEWDHLTTRRARSRRITRFALAASVLLAVLAGLNVLHGPFDFSGVEQVASIEKQFGIINVRSADGDGFETAEILSIVSGQSVETGLESGLTLAWNDGGSLRLDQNTRVDFESESEIYLLSGRIYFDSMPSGVPSVLTQPDKARLTIRTEAGTVRHFGTQFITQTDGDELNVLVREGTVLIEADGFSEAATVGQKLTVRRNGQPSVHVVGIIGGDWQWIEKTSPSFTLDNRPIIEFLNWVSRETGRPVRFASPAAERAAREGVLRGVVEMEPSRALRTFMPAAALTWHIEGDEIVVGDDDPNSRSGGT